MSRQASNSWNHFGVRGPDGVLEALPFYTGVYRSDWLAKGFGYRKNPADGKPLFRVKWYTLDLKQRKAIETPSTMPPDARLYGAAVACGNLIYVIGGDCSGDLSCSDKSRKDLRLRATQGRKGHFAEVFSVELNRRDILPAPPVASGLAPESVSDHVLLDSSRSRILVHFGSNKSLQAFHFHADGGSWECVDPEFGIWSEASPKERLLSWKEMLSRRQSPLRCKEFTEEHVREDYHQS
ncbi:hypothetical protein V6N12_008597 [Hibiscus sabdariffa]|uniref:Uncharacterized protein n=1 Tax=Hibiscus sabdariffa TaxID=183260 RepID=A0ABR2BJC7_9ROSI